MASTIGHALCGIDCLLLARAVAPERFPRLSLKSATGFVFLANLPDLDLIVGPLIGEHPHYFHGQVTHSIIFALGFATLFMWGARYLLKSAHNSAVLFLVAFIPLLSHVIVDFFTGPSPGFNPSFGITWAWPFSNQQLSAPVTLFLGPHHASMAGLLSWHNVIVMVRELLLFGGTGVLILVFCRQLRGETATFLLQLRNDMLRNLARSNN